MGNRNGKRKQDFAQKAAWGFANKNLQGWLWPRDTLVHEQRSTVMDFKFHLLFGPVLDWYQYQRWVHMTKHWYLLITHQSYDSWWSKPYRYTRQLLQWRWNLYCERFCMEDTLMQWLQGRRKGPGNQCLRMRLISPTFREFRIIP